jgi:hypothetical protein
MELFRDDQYLEIRNMNEQDAGTYSCLAQNLAGKAKQNLELQVLGEKFSIKFTILTLFFLL